MDPYPALFDLLDQTHHSLGTAAVFRVGRRPDVELVVRDVHCSRDQFRLVREDARYFLEPLSRTCPTLCDGNTVTGRLLLRHGAVIAAGPCQFRFLARADSSADVVPETIVIRAGVPQLAAATAPAPLFPLAGDQYIGRDPALVQIVLPHASVSRCHAFVEAIAGMATLTDLDSTNGTRLNGRLLDEPARLRYGDSVEIGPYLLTFTGQAFTFVPDVSAL